MRKIAFILGLFMVLATAVTAAEAPAYNYINPEQFKGWLEKGMDMVIVDIQVPEAYAGRHFKGAIETNAFPVKSDEERARLDQTLARINATTAPVVIVCPRGGGGAKATYDYLKAKGVAEDRLLILLKGMDGWPYPEMCVSGR